jgi:CRP-like cAMP-binding protein
VLEFRKFIENYTTLSLSDWEIISNCFEYREIEKNEIILQEGEICKHLYFLETGLLHYFINKEGNEITKFFTNAPYCFTSQMSFNNEKPATENIQAIEKSVVWQITLKQSNELFELESWTIFAKKILQEVQFFTEEILEEIQTETAEFRYRKMVTNDAELTNRIPLKYLASFLGIAPQSLSRIRKKLVEKDKS